MHLLLHCTDIMERRRKNSIRRKNSLCMATEMHFKDYKYFVLTTPLQLQCILTVSYI